MIAEKGSRRHGLAETALKMLMAYAAQDLVSQISTCECDAQVCALHSLYVTWNQVAESYILMSRE